jgi:hypothetical protein
MHFFFSQEHSDEQQESRKNFMSQIPCNNVCHAAEGNTNTLNCNSMVVVTIVSHMFRLDYPLGLT